MTEWSKIDKEMATATYENVLKLFNEDGSVPEKGMLLVIDELKKLGKVERDKTIACFAPIDSQRCSEGARDHREMKMRHKAM